jgi:hypothetical protein
MFVLSVTRGSDARSPGASHQKRSSAARTLAGRHQRREGGRVEQEARGDEPAVADDGPLGHRDRPRADGRRSIYSLTQREFTLIPALVEMIVWSAKEDPQTAADEASVEEALRDRDGLIRRLQGRGS